MRLCEHGSVCQKNCEAILAENVAGRSLFRFVENVTALGSKRPHQGPLFSKTVLVGHYIANCCYNLT